MEKRSSRCEWHQREESDNEQGGIETRSGVRNECGSWLGYVMSHGISMHIFVRITTRNDERISK